MNFFSGQDIAAFWTDSLTRELQTFFTGRIKCPDAAADLTHETFLRFHRFVENTPPNNARALAFSIAVNLATDYQRKMKVRNKIMVDTELEPGPQSFGQAAENKGPERLAMAQQELQLLYAALDELPADCRSAFMLHSVDGLTQAQIATQLGVSPSKVYRLLIAAMSHCQQRINQANEAKK